MGGSSDWIPISDSGWRRHHVWNMLNGKGILRTTCWLLKFLLRSVTFAPIFVKQITWLWWPSKGTGAFLEGEESAIFEQKRWPPLTLFQVFFFFKQVLYFWDLFIVLYVYLVNYFSWLQSNQSCACTTFYLLFP